MSEKSRDEKLAAAKKKLKKFQDNNVKEKTKKNKPIDCSLSGNQLRVYFLLNHNHYGMTPFPNFVCTVPNNSDIVHMESIEYQPDETDVSVHINRKNNYDFVNDMEEPTVTTESLKHISRHLNGIISRSSSSIDRETHVEYMNTIRDLENRNIELANYNSQKAEQMEALHVKVANLNETLARINKDRANELSSLESSYKRQIDSNKDQFQAQIHTISLLVAEKSELQSQVTHNQKVAGQRHQENEDITNKLKASRQKVGDLEKALIEMKSKNVKLEEAYRDMSRQTEQLRNTLKRLKSEKEDIETECLQLRSKLISKTQEVSNLEINLDDVKSHLEMSQVQIQHLTNSQENHYDDMYAQLKLTEQKNLELMQNLDCVKLQLQQGDSQNARVQNQYRNYFEQMEEKIKSLQSNLSVTMDQKNEISEQFETFKRNVSDMKEAKNIDVAYLQNSIISLQNEKESLIERIEQSESLIKILQDSNDSLSKNNVQLTKVSEELEEKNMDLIEKNNQFQINKVDHIELLQQLQSDKTALSRALAQNKQLKSQLIELQEAFVKLSSDNMDLSTKLDHEKHVSKELSLRLGEQEDELSEIRLIVENKDEEIIQLVKSNKQITEELLTTNNNSENYSNSRSESHFNMANKELIMMLQTDVSHLQEKINHLTSENNALRYNNAHSNDEINSSNNAEISYESNNSDIITNRQLKAERDELLRKCETYSVLQLEWSKLIENYKEATDENDSIVTKEKYKSLQMSLAEINRRFSEIMEKNIELNEYNNRLEHIIAQLECETDTIGEYISLYQHQRSMLKQRSLAKDQFMSKLMHEKQLLDSRLLRLESLIKNLSLRDKYNENDMKCNHDLDYENHECNHKASTIDEIFNILFELQKPTNYMFQTSEKSSDETEMISTSDHTFTSDNLFHSEFIHCKCCVGKVIDL